eukprot:SAG22_NODE_7167_length_768_cov_1.133034_1_plen_143_part_10
MGRGAAAARKKLQALEQAAALDARLRTECAAVAAAPAPATLLSLGTLGSAVPGSAAAAGGSPGTPGPSGRPFCCGVRIEVRGLTIDQAVEQGEAVVTEVVASLARGPEPTADRGRSQPGAEPAWSWFNLPRPGTQEYVMQQAM